MQKRHLRERKKARQLAPPGQYVASCELDRMSWSDATKGAHQPKDYEDQQDQADHSAEPATTITAMGVVAAAAKQRQKQYDNQQ
jgi:hypothetical protein